MSDETTELGILAEDAFKNASAAMYGQEHEAAQIVHEAVQQSDQMFRAIHQRALALVITRHPSPEQLRSIVRMQQIAGEFLRVVECAEAIATQAVALGGLVDAFLLGVSEEAPFLLLQVVRQAYVEMRGCVIATTTSDTALARRLIAEDEQLDMIFAQLRDAIQAAIREHIELSPQLHRVLLVGVHLAEIGDRVVAICRTLLFDYPADLHPVG